MPALARQFATPLRGLGWLALAGVLLTIGRAWSAEDAMNRPPLVTPVYQLLRPAYDPPGIMLGSFLLSPSFDQELVGNDNIFASGHDIAGDLIFTTGQDLKIASQWSRDSVTAHLYHAHDLYARHPTENANSWGLEGGVRLGVSEGGALQLEAGIVQQPQQRNNPEADRSALARPIYNTIPASLSYSQDVGRWNNRMEAGVIQTAYIASAEASRNGIQARYRDRLSYRMTGDTWSFLQVAYSTHHWNVRSALRDFDTLTAMAGVTVQIPDLVDLDLGAGVVRQHYDYAGFSELVTPSFNGHLTWNILPLTTILVTADRSVTGLETFCNDGLANPACLALDPAALTTLNSVYNDVAPRVRDNICRITPGNPVCAGPLPASFLAFDDRFPTLGNQVLARICDFTPAIRACTGSIFNTGLRGTLEVTSAEITVQHEFWHNILGTVRFRYEKDRFDPVALVDDNYSVDVGARFLLNRYLELNASYVMNKRTANQPLLLYNSGPYQADIVTLQLKAAL